MIKLDENNQRERLSAIAELEDLCRVLRLRQTLIGQLPPEPPTARGRIGSLLVKAVRRTLFWYTAQIQNFHAGVVQGFDQQLAALNTLATASQQSWQTVDDLREEVAKLHAELNRVSRHLETEAVAREGLQHGLQAETGAREELARRVEAEAVAREGLQHGLQAETGAREELARRVEAEAAAREGLQQGLQAEAGAREELARRVEAEAAAREGLQQGLQAEAGAREELARRVEAEAAAREGLQQGLQAEAGAREELARRVEAEAVAREGLQQGLQAEAGTREELDREVKEHSQGRQALEASYRQIDMGLHHLRAEVTGQATRISVLLAEARKKISKVSDNAQLVRLSEEDQHALDAFYLSLEDRFRGTRDEIMQRQRFYLPFLQDQKIGGKQMPILDIGCGRGEWLELLTESGLEARGVDLNRVFVAACKERGLNVSEGDALEYLRDLPTGSVGAVTGFHIIEHLPLGELISLIDEAVRVLKPGGLAIFETPNPQNVLVGCHNFYIDPTHRNPLPAVTVQFMLEARGLCDVQILNLHPYPESFKVRDGGPEMMQRFNDYFYGPQDYGVIGKRV
jgi:SAM-dependent methyltransferase